MHEQLKETRDDIGDIIIEPEAKNTAPAILAACIYSIMQNDNPILLVTPSDHIIPNTQTFHETILNGLSEVNLGKNCNIWY